MALFAISALPELLLFARFTNKAHELFAAVLRGRFSASDKHILPRLASRAPIKSPHFRSPPDLPRFHRRYWTKENGTVSSAALKMGFD